jgi:DNA-binding Lrp family transcriptional regulator
MTHPAASARGAPADDPIVRLRLASRLAVAFVLDAIAIARDGRHVLDTLLTSAIIQANVQEITRRADLQVTYAEIEEPPPDELRRPVTMNALASSLELPFETVRRRVQRLVAEGMVRHVEGGVIVPTAVLDQPKYYESGFRGYERLRAFYYQLSDLGLLRDLPPPSADLAGGIVPVRAVARLAGAYVLRVIEALGSIGDLIDGLIVLEVFRSNIEHVSSDLRGGEGFEHADMLPDSERRPIPVLALAGRLGIPHETARRHVMQLIERDIVVRVRGGLIVPAENLTRPQMRPTLTANAGNLQRLFGALSQLGVLRIWDSVRAG